MKQFLTLVFSAIATIAISNAQAVLPQPIEPFYLPVGANKTTVLILPTPVKNVDRGNSLLIARTVKDMENILKIKFQNDTNLTTSLHVFTADRKVYNFITFYDNDPVECTWDFTTSETKPNTSTSYYFPSSKNVGGIKLKPTGVYIDNKILYLRFKIRNRFTIPFQIHFTRFIIKDNKTARRTSITEKEMTPISNFPLLPETINGSSAQEYSIAFDQFTIAAKKHLSIQVFEKNGDRNITCKISGRRLLRAKPFNNKIEKICRNQ